MMKHALISKNKWKFLDGSLPMPDRFDPSFDAWERCNNIIHSWLVSSIAASIPPSIVHMELAIKVWNNLKERFSEGDLVRISDLQVELYAFKQGNLSVTDFFPELTVFWEELENYRPINDCNCSKYRDEDYVMRFLTGLNECYSVVKTQILMMVPWTPLTRVFSMSLQHETTWIR